MGFYIAVCAVIAVVTGLVGFAGVAGEAVSVGMAKALCVVFVLLAFCSAVMGRYLPAVDAKQ